MFISNIEIAISWRIPRDLHKMELLVVILTRSWLDFASNFFFCLRLRTPSRLQPPSATTKHIQVDVTQETRNTERGTAEEDPPSRKSWQFQAHPDHDVATRPRRQKPREEPRGRKPRGKTLQQDRHNATSSPTTQQRPGTTFLEGECHVTQ